MKDTCSHQHADNLTDIGSNRLASWIDRLSLTLLLLYAFSYMVLPEVGEPLQKLAIFLGVCLWLVALVRNGRDFSFYLLLGAILIPVVSWAGAWLAHPQWAEHSPKVHRVADWLWCFPIAILLGRRIRFLYLLWAAAVVGLLLAPWLSGHGWPELVQGFKGGRIDFGLHNAQHTGMLYAVAVLGLLAFAPRFFFSSHYRCTLSLCWAVAFLSCLFGIVVSQTRAVWLGLLLAMFFIPVVSLLFVDRKRYRHLVLVFGLGMTALLLLFFFSPLYEVATNRLVADQANIAAVVNLDTAKLNNRSLGIRIKTWLFAYDWIEQRPLTGWGGNGRRIIYENAENVPNNVTFGHFHNSYVDILVCYGVLGLVFYFSILAVFVRRVYFGYRCGKLSPEMFVYFLSFLVFWFFVNLFESYMFFSSGSYVLSLVFGGSLTHIWSCGGVADSVGEESSR